MAGQIIGLVTANKLIDGFNKAFGKNMPLLTLSFAISTVSIPTEDGDALLVADYDQPTE
jgi:hypothetical protein